MGRAGAITGLAALASAVLFVSLIVGAPAAPLLTYLVQLPLMLVGLAFGSGMALLASAGAGITVLAVGGLLGAGMFLVIEAVPVLLAVQPARLWRERDGRVDWYPPGAILVRLVAYALVVSLAALGWLAAESGDLPGALVAIGRSAAEQAGVSPAADMVGAALARWAHWLPGVVAFSWVLMTVVNGLLALWLANRAGWHARPLPDIVALELPATGAALFAACLLAALVTAGGLQVALATGALLLAVPYLFLGLAVAHAAVRARSAGRGPLVALYALLLVFSWPLVLLVVALGAVEPWARLRRRLVQSGG